MRYFAYRVVSGELVHTDLPLARPRLGRTLSGAHSLRARMEPAVHDELVNTRAADGLPILFPWATFVLAATDTGTVPFGGPLVRARRAGPTYELEAASTFAWLSRQYWLGGTYRRVRIDPLRVVRDLVAATQGHANAVPITVTGDTGSPLVVGESENLLPLNVATGTDTLTTTEGFTSVDAALSSSTAWSAEGGRSLEADMGPSHAAGAQIAEIDPQPVEPGSGYSFYGGVTTGATEPNQDREVTLVARFLDGAGGVVAARRHQEKLRVPSNSRNEFRQFRWEGLSNASQAVAAVALSLESDGDDDPMAYFVDNLTFRKGAGVQHPYEVSRVDGVNIGDEIASLAGAEPGFDFADEVAGTPDAPEFRLRLGYPRLGARRHELTFSTDWNIGADTPELADGDDYANIVLGVGRGEGQDGATSLWWARSELVPWVMDTFQRKDLRRPELNRLTKRRVTTASRMTTVSQVTVRDSPAAPLWSWQIGDDLHIHAETPWGTIALWTRVTSDEIDLDSREATLNLQPADTFVYGPSEGAT